MGDFDACRFDFRLDAKNGLMPSKRRKTERIQPSNYSTLFKCKICGTLFTCRMLLLEHKMTHSEYRYNKCKYECGLCADKKFSRKDHLRDHLLREHQLEEAKAAEVMGEGRQRQATGRKSRGSTNRKSADCSLKKYVLKRASKSSNAGDDDDVQMTSEGATDDVNTSLECGSNVQSNPALPESSQVPERFGDKYLPSNYLYINFPILVAPPTTIANESTGKPHPAIQTDMNWSSPSLPVDLAERLKVEIDDQARETAPQTGGIFDLPSALSRFLAYNNFVSSRRDGKNGRNDCSSETPDDVQQFSLFPSTIKRDPGSVEERLPHPHPAQQLCFLEPSSTLNDVTDSSRQENIVLDYSLKTSNHLACYDQNNLTAPSNHQREVVNDLLELDTAVDLSRKGRSTALPACRSFEISDEKEELSEKHGKWSESWTVDHHHPSSQKANFLPDTQTKQLGSTVGSCELGFVRSAIVPAPVGKTKSVLNKTVEKLWKNKFGRISDTTSSNTLDNREHDIVKFDKVERVCGESRTTTRNLANDVDQQCRKSPEISLWPDSGWNFSAESTAKTQSSEFPRDHRKFLDLLQNIEDKEFYQQLIRQYQESENCFSISGDDGDQHKLERAESDVIDLTTTSTISGRLIGEVFPVSTTPDTRGFSVKAQSFASQSYHATDSEESPPSCQPGHSFYQNNGVFEIASGLRIPVNVNRSSDETLNENSSALWSDQNRDIGHNGVDLKTATFELIKDDHDTSESSYPNGEESSRSNRTDNLLNCGYPQCGKTFKEWRHLKVHLTLHTGEKPLSCYLCKYTCRHRSSMNWHMKSKHRMEKSKIHGNRTVYIDVAGAGEFACGGNSETETRSRILKAPEVIHRSSADEKEATFLDGLRTSLNFLSDGLKSDVPRGTQAATGTDDDLMTRVERLKDDGDDSERSMNNSNEKRHDRNSPNERSLEESVPQLLLKKVTASPGKDPKFFTSLMRIKYTKHASKLRSHRQPFKRRSGSVKRQETVTHSSDQSFDCTIVTKSPLSNEHDRERIGSNNKAGMENHLFAGKEIQEPKNSTCSSAGEQLSGLNHQFRHQNVFASVHLTCLPPNHDQILSGNEALRYQIESVHPSSIPGNPPGNEEAIAHLTDTEPPVSTTPSPPPVVGAFAPLLAQLDERPLSCDYPGCDKSFREVKHLKVHQMQHTDEKPLGCIICDYSCRQRNSMNWHMKSKHGLEKHVTNDGRTVYI